MANVQQSFSDLVKEAPPAAPMGTVSLVGTLAQASEAEKFVLTLHDGSMVTLNIASVRKYAVLGTTADQTIVRVDVDATKKVPAQLGSTAVSALTVGVQDASQGILTLAGPAAGIQGGEIVINNIGNAGIGNVTISNGSWDESQAAVTYIRPNDANSPGILDILCNGNGGSTGQTGSWIDVGSDYTVDHTNGEFIMISKLPSEYGFIAVKGLGTGTARPLVLQPGSAGTVTTNGQICSGTASPTGVYQYYFQWNQNTGTQLVVENTNTGTAAFAQMGVSNENSNSNGLLALDSLGSGFASSGAFIANTGVLDAGSGLTSLGILTRNASANIYLYPGGRQVGAFTAAGDFVLGTGAISTSATSGFLYIPSCAGQPTGTPTGHTGRVPVVFDTTDDKFWIYTGGTWKGVVVS
jgi:hypothetical protein